MPNKETPSSAWLFLSALIFMVLGLAYNPLFFAVAIFLFSVAEARRSKAIGAVGAAFGLLFLFLILGYGFGKDAALRDNMQSPASTPGNAS